MSTVYLSGPITGLPDLNRLAFELAAIDLRHKGYRVINPHEACIGLPPSSTWLDYMRVDIKALVMCDAIYMLPGWWKSRGARIEWVIAKMLGIKRIK
jgi:hypothetical protein